MRPSTHNTVKQINRTMKVVSSLVLGGFGLMLILQSSPRFQKKAELAAPKNEPPATVMMAVDSKETSAPSAQTPPNSEQEKFRQELQVLGDSLPTLQAIQKKASAEIHETPPEVVEAGVRFGALKERWMAAAELKPLAFEFYVGCMNNTLLVTSVRSLCLVNSRQLSKELQKPLDQSSVPTQVKNLADQLER